MPPREGSSRDGGLTPSEYAAAADFKAAFRPKVGRDYSAVLERAKAQFADRLADFNDIDAKAHAVIGYMGGMAGVLTVGSVVTAATSDVDPWILLSASPAVVFAVLATVFVAWCRRTGTVPAVVGAQQMVRFADFVADLPPEDAKKMMDAAVIAPWWQADARLAAQVRRKGGWLNSAFWMFWLSVASLALPFAVAVVMKFAAKADKAKPEPAIPYVQ